MKEKIYNFVIRISKEDKEIIRSLKIDGINISSFIRKCLREKNLENKK